MAKKEGQVTISFLVDRDVHANWLESKGKKSWADIMKTGIIETLRKKDPV